MSDQPNGQGWQRVSSGTCGQPLALWLLVLLLALLLSARIVHAQEGEARAAIAETDWPSWRGADGLGVRTAPIALLRWSSTAGVAWKVPVPGVGHASPIVVGDRVILSTADERLGPRTLICFHRKTGATLWQTPTPAGALMARHQKNSHASPTPACDGRLIYLPHIAADALWLTAFGVEDGRVRWQRQLGPFTSEWGYASSPVVYRNRVIVVGDNKGTSSAPDAADPSYLVGVDARSGEVAWRVRRPSIPSYGTPIVAHIAGRDQLLLSGTGRIVSFDPATGKEIWSCRWSANRSANSMVHGGNFVYASTSWPHAEMMCIRADGSGDVTETHVVWQHGRSVNDIPSAVYHEGRLYVVSDRGIASCLDGATGKSIWQQRLGSNFSASPVLIGNRLFATDEAGTTHVLEVGPKFKRLATNSLNDPVLASPAVSGDRIFLRSGRFLWCIDGQTPARAQVAAPPPLVRPRAPSAPKAPSPPGVTPPESKWEDWLLLLGAIGLGLALAVVLVVWWRRQRADALEVVEVGEEDCLEDDALEVVEDDAVEVGEEDCLEDDEAVIEEAYEEEVEPPPLISFACTGCGRTLTVPPELAGRKGKCRQCGQSVRAPGVAMSADGVRAKASESTPLPKNRLSRER